VVAGAKVEISYAVTAISGRDWSRRTVKWGKLDCGPAFASVCMMEAHGHLQMSDGRIDAGTIKNRRSALYELDDFKKDLEADRRMRSFEAVIDSKYRQRQP